MGRSVRQSLNVKRCLMFGVIPALAIAVAARQLYLSTTDDLSTWKGGGMGMFAGSESKTRYAKIYLVSPDGRRQPVLRITPEQERLKKQFLNYPNQRNFRTLAQSIKDTLWWATDTSVPLNVFDQTGQKVRDGAEKLYDLYPMRSKRNNPLPDLSVEVEYWKADYDPPTGSYTGTLAMTYKLER